VVLLLRLFFKRLCEGPSVLCTETLSESHRSCTSAFTMLGPGTGAEAGAKANGTNWLSSQFIKSSSISNKIGARAVPIVEAIVVFPFLRLIAG